MGSRLVFGVSPVTWAHKVLSAMIHRPGPARPLMLCLGWLGLILASLGTANGAPSLRVVGTAGAQRVEFRREAGSGRHYVRAARSLEELPIGYLVQVLPPDGPSSGNVELPGALAASAAVFVRLESEPTSPPPLPGLAWVPAGTFWMGSPADEYGRDDDESPLHEVTISRGFWIGTREVTQAEYLAEMGTNSSHFTSANGFAATLQNPAEQVSWADATNYCGRLTRRLQAEGALAPGLRVRLPTEAEWEYAARAGTRTAYNFGTGLTTNLANFDWKWEHDTTKGFIHHPNNPFPAMTLPVGSFPANPFGLHDVHGNVWEWVADWHALYDAAPAVDPTGPATGIYKVQRSGGWHIFAWHCRSANRSIKVLWWERKDNVGFRVVVEAAAPGN